MDVYQRRRLVAVLAVVLVLVLAVVAIAGGGDDEGEPIEPADGASAPGVATPLSKSEFISQGDSTCEEIATAIANIDSSDPQQAADEELDYTRNGLLSQLRSLTPPQEDQATLNQFFSALEDLVAALKQNSQAIADGDTTAETEASTEIETAKSAFLAAAKDYGFKSCGEEGEPSARPTTGNGADGTEVPATPVTPTTTPPATTPPATTPPSSGGTGDDTGGGDGGGDGGGGGGSSGGVGPG
jgi:hypothetical protein